MSGCLIFQRPDICSTTSFESMRTWTDAAGVALEARPRGPRSCRCTRRRCCSRCRRRRRPRSAPSPDCVIEDHRSPGGDAGIAARAAVGFDDEPAGHRPDSSVRTRMHPHSGQVTTASSAARRTLCISVPASTIRHPSHVPRRSSAAPAAARGDAVVVAPAARRRCCRPPRRGRGWPPRSAAVASATTRLASALSSRALGVGLGDQRLLRGDRGVGLLRAAP